jgi:riboflavin synthase
MFTGLITGMGRVSAVDSLGDTQQYGKRISIEVPVAYLDDVEPGDSIAINGACMTVTSLDREKSRFTIDMSMESLSKVTGFNALAPVNLEKALRADDRLGGHIVSGHVDGIGHVSYFARVGESWTLRIQIPVNLARYLAYKGSIAVNGVSLTVNEVTDNSQGCEISINLIPHTVQNTVFSKMQPGALVNLEVDTVARYVERMLSHGHKPSAHQ